VGGLSGQAGGARLGLLESVVDQFQG
jgi:hypothetical protein